MNCELAVMRRIEPTDTHRILMTKYRRVCAELEALKQEYAWLQRRYDWVLGDMAKMASEPKVVYVEREAEPKPKRTRKGRAK